MSTIALESIKHFKNWKKDMKNFSAEKYQTLTGGIKEDVNKWRDISHLWTRRLNTIKAAILSKLISRVNVIHIILTLGGFCKNWKADSNVYTEINRI